MKDSTIPSSRQLKGNITRIVGLGPEAPDGHLRITQGEHFGVLMGSESSHDAMRQIGLVLEQRLAEQGRRLEDLSQEEALGLLAELEEKGEG